MLEHHRRTRLVQPRCAVILQLVAAFTGQANRSLGSVRFQLAVQPPAHAGTSSAHNGASSRATTMGVTASPARAEVWAEVWAERALSAAEEDGLGVRRGPPPTRRPGS